MIKDYLYSIIAVVHIDDQETQRFILGFLDSAEVHRNDDSDYLMIVGVLDEDDYKTLYAKQSTKDEALVNAFITFKRLGDATQQQHMDSTWEHFKNHVIQ